MKWIDERFPFLYFLKRKTTAYEQNFFGGTVFFFKFWYYTLIYYIVNCDRDSYGLTLLLWTLTFHNGLALLRWFFETISINCNFCNGMLYIACLCVDCIAPDVLLCTLVLTWIVMHYRIKNVTTWLSETKFLNIIEMTLDITEECTPGFHIRIETWRHCKCVLNNRTIKCNTKKFRKRVSAYDIKIVTVLIFVYF